MPLVVQWTVKTIDTFPIYPGKSFLSSRFYVNNTKAAEFCLRILGEFPSSEEGKIGSLFLCRCGNDGPKTVEVEYKISSTFGRGGVSLYKRQFLKPQRNVSYRCYEADALPVMKEALSFGDLTVGCVIYENGSHVAPEHQERDDFVHLSDAVTELLDRSLFSDAVIRTPNKEFKIHKAVLEARCPALLKECQTGKARETHSQYDDYTLEMLLHYIYTGKLKSENVPDELYLLVKQYNESIFSHIFLTLPDCTHLNTSFEVKEIFFHWAVENLLDYPRKSECCYKIRDGDPSTWFKLTFTTFQSKDETKHLEFMVHKMFKTATTFVRCKIRTFSTEADDPYIFQGNHLFIDEYPWKVQLDQKINSIREGEKFGVIEFYIELEIADSELVNSVKSITFLSTSCQSERLRDLCHDIGKLYENPQHSDVVLKVKSKRIPAHKAILSARSSVFRQKLQQKETAQVIINDLDEKVALSMIYYIYSALVVDLNIDLAFELYKAANLYKISPLKRKCSKFLEDSLTAENVREILLFAEDQKDHGLKSKASDFMI